LRFEADGVCLVVMLIGMSHGIVVMRDELKKY
jgi:hypothetical protein